MYPLRVPHPPLLFLGLVGIKAMTGQMNERVLERRLAKSDGLDLIAKRLDQVTHEFVAALALDSQCAIDQSHPRFHSQLYLCAQSFGILRADHDYVAAHARFQLGWGRECGQSPIMQNSEPIASFCLFHMVRRDNDRDIL